MLAAISPRDALTWYKAAQRNQSRVSCARALEISVLRHGEVLLLKRELSTETYKYVVWLDGDAAILDQDKSFESFIHQVWCAAQRVEAFRFLL